MPLYELEYEQRDPQTGYPVMRTVMTRAPTAHQAQRDAAERLPEDAEVCDVRQVSAS